MDRDLFELMKVTLPECIRLASRSTDPGVLLSATPDLIAQDALRIAKRALDLARAEYKPDGAPIHDPSSPTLRPPPPGSFPCRRCHHMLSGPGICGICGAD